MRNSFFLILIGLISFFLLSCKKEISCEDCNVNKPPIAIAGPDQVVTLPTDSIRLDGSASNDPDGTISEWLWTKISGPASFHINRSADSVTTVKNLTAGVYQFELKVTDYEGLSAKDTMQVIINDPSQPNRPPTANAGADQTINFPINNVSVNGSTSTDPDNNIVSYVWTKISGPASFTILMSTAAETLINDLVLGVYQFELKVTDAGGFFSKDTILITINPPLSASILPCDSNSADWTQLQFLPSDEFFFGPRYWFNGDNFLMGIDNTVYAVSNKGRVWKYNGSANTWQMIGDFPENMSYMPVVFSVNGSGYCIGNGNCWQFNPSTNQWTIKNDPPDDLYAPLVINGKVYFKNNNNQIVVYDPAFDTYAVRNDCPDTQLMGWFVINGQGFHVYENGQCWKYNPANDSWQQKANLVLPGILYNSCSFSLNNSGYILGDLNSQSYNNNEPMRVVKYNSTLDKWTNCASENYPGYGAYLISAISFNNVVYVGLGYNNGDFNATDFWKFQ